MSEYEHWISTALSAPIECQHSKVIPVLVGDGVVWLCSNRDCKQEFVPAS